jgi:hypothetical protein
MPRPWASPKNNKRRYKHGVRNTLFNHTIAKKARWLTKAARYDSYVGGTRFVRWGVKHGDCTRFENEKHYDLRSPMQRLPRKHPSARGNEAVAAVNRRVPFVR